MDRSAFTSSARGRVRRTPTGYYAFIPEALPRTLDYSEGTVHKLNDAVAAVHRLGGASRILPNPDLLSFPYIQVEAVLSSKIEGTQTTVHELLKFEADPEATPDRDLQEVRNYASALSAGFESLTGLPLSVRLLRKMHAALFDGVSGAQAPGKLRSSQNWIGPPGCTIETARFVPPPHEEMGWLLSDLEKFLHERDRPALVTLAMAHYQFEVIHPFLDGNGRIGRLLVPLVLAEREILKWPLLPLSVYFEQHRSMYYDLLFEVSTKGDFTPWFDFFFDGVQEQAQAAEERAVRLVDIRSDLHERLLKAKVSNACHKLGDRLLANPFVTARSVRQHISVSPPTAHATIARLVALGILREVTGRVRNRIYVATEIFDAVYAGVGTPAGSR